MVPKIYTACANARGTRHPSAHSVISRYFERRREKETLDIQGHACVPCAGSRPSGRDDVNIQYIIREFVIRAGGAGGVRCSPRLRRRRNLRKHYDYGRTSRSARRSPPRHQRVDSRPRRAARARPRSVARECRPGKNPLGLRSRRTLTRISPPWRRAAAASPIGSRSRIRHSTWRRALLSHTSRPQKASRLEQIRRLRVRAGRSTTSLERLESSNSSAPATGSLANRGLLTNEPLRPARQHSGWEQHLTGTARRQPARTPRSRWTASGLHRTVALRRGLFAPSRSRAGHLADDAEGPRGAYSGAVRSIGCCTCLDLRAFADLHLIEETPVEPSPAHVSTATPGSRPRERSSMKPMRVARAVRIWRGLRSQSRSSAGNAMTVMPDTRDTAPLRGRRHRAIWSVSDVIR